MKIQELKEYVSKEHDGHVYDAACKLNVTPTTVYANLKMTAFVYKHELYRVTRRKVNRND